MLLCGDAGPSDAGPRRCCGRLHTVIGDGSVLAKRRYVMLLPRLIYAKLWSIALHCVAVNYPTTPKSSPDALRMGARAPQAVRSRTVNTIHLCAASV